MDQSKSSEKRQPTNYDEILARFRAEEKPNREAVRHLENLGFRSGQARSAVYQYRKKRGLVRQRKQQRGSEH
jgi:hypothetical protein